MPTLDNHRILIASLFLPNTVNLSPHGSPTLKPLPNGRQGPSKPLIPPPPVRPAPTRLKSIVEDLTEKAHTPAPSSPELELPDPFTPTPGILTASALRPLSKQNTRPSTPSRVPSGTGNTFSPINLTLSSTRPSRLGRPPNDITSTPSPASVRSTTPSSPGLSRRSSRNTSRPGSVRRSNSLVGATTDGRHGLKPWEVQGSFHGNVGLHKAVASVDDKVRKKLWIGVLDLPTDDIGEEMRKDIDFRLGLSDNVPVWVKDEEFTGCYDVFCHQVLWPSLHYAVPDAPKTKVFYESSSFAQYKAVNQKFADAIVSAYQEGDIVWVNDYHLCLVPQLVRQKIPNATIGFFMHVAWPSTEIFRCLAVREQLLYGLLGADLIGFQTHNYARHFRQTCSRILALEALPKGIQLENSFVDVAVFPIGIDVQDLTIKRQDPDVEEWGKILLQRYEGRKLIVARDKLDGVHGVRHKLIAFEEFLDKYPEFQGKVVLIQVALATTEQNELQASITDVVSRVNSRFGSLTYQPVVLLHTQDLTFPMYLGLLTVADAFMVTSLREGMALRTHEFVECQERRKRPLILSEFTGSYSYSGFRSCIAINPWDYKNTADAIHQSLTMSDEEANSRWQDLHSHVITQTAQAFVTSFLTRCIRVHAEHLQRSPTSIPILSQAALLPKYQSAHKRLIFLDLESTLWTEHPRVMREQGFLPPRETINVLRSLVHNERNKVWVLSGFPISGALEKLAAEVPGLGLVAENGCFIKSPQSIEWTSMVSKLSFSWKSICVEILSYFTERTPGSFVEERGASVVWRFPTVNPRDEAAKQWARRQAAEAQNHIWDSLGERFGLRIIPGATSFLVLPKNVSRSTAVGAILKHDSAPTSLATASALAFSAAAPPRAASPAPTQIVQPPSSPAANADSEQNIVQNQSGNPGTTGAGVDITAAANEFDLILTLSGDEHLIRRLNRLEGAETCTTSGKGSDAMWRLDSSEVVKTLRVYAEAAFTNGRV